MKILSIETSGNVCGVALSDNKKIIAEYSASGGNIHDKLCAEFVRRILEDFEFTISDIDAVAVSAGPADSRCFAGQVLVAAPELLVRAMTRCLLLIFHFEGETEAFRHPDPARDDLLEAAADGLVG